MVRKQHLERTTTLGGRGGPAARDYAASGFMEQGDKAEEVPPPPIICEEAVKKSKLSDGTMLESPLSKLFKGQFAKKKDGTMINALSETNGPGEYTVSNVSASHLKLHNMLRLTCVEHFRQSVGQVAKIGIVGLVVSQAARRTTKAMSELLRVATMYRPLVFLFAILLSSTQVYSATHDTNFNEGTCCYDMISLAVLLCMQPDKTWNSPSVSCCKALLHAIDELPASRESGECCLCRFIRSKLDSLDSLELAATYIACHGKDSALVARWSFPVKMCGKACLSRKIAPPHEDTTMQGPPSHSHGSNTKKILSISFAVFFVTLLICIVYLWCVRRAAQVRRGSLPLRKPEMQGRRSSLGGDTQTDRGRSSGRLKERRASGQSHREAPNS